jgi:hypothetical protein
MRTTASLLAWTTGWVASLAVARFGPALWDVDSALTALAIAVSVVIGIGMLAAHRRLLRSMDELQRTIQLETMALTLGAGLVGGIAWTLVTGHDLVTLDAEIAHLVAFMGVVYLVGSIAGVLRYR